MTKLSDQQGQAQQQGSQQAQNSSQGQGQQAQGNFDQQLEQSLFTLAYDKLQSKLPNLLKQLVGFQVVHKEQDGSKVVAVFAFKADTGCVLFAPVIYLNGKVKDMLLLYCADTNTFCPLSEEWAELYLRSNNTGIGEPSDESRQEIERQVVSPSMRDLCVPPRTGRNSYASVIDYISESDNSVKTAAWSLMEKHADFTEALLRFYSEEQIAQALVPVKTAAVPKLTKVKVEYTAKGLFPDKTPDTQGKGYKITDNRASTEKSKFGQFEYRTKIGNPATSGFYSYITEVGTLRYGLILTDLSPIQQFLPQPSTIVIDLDATKPGQAYAVLNKDIYIRENIIVADYANVLSGLEDPAEGKPSYSDTYILINNNLRGVAPFNIIANYKDENGLRRLKVERSTQDDRGGCVPCVCGEDRSTTMVLTKQEGDKISYRGAIMYVPKGFKLLKLDFNSHIEPPWNDKDSQATREKKREKAREESEKIRAGKPGKVSALTAMLQSQGVFPMSVQTNGSEYFTTIKAVKKTYESPMRAKIGMVLDIGLDEKQAEEIIDSLHIGTPIKGYCKVAVTGGGFSFSLQDETPYSNELGQNTTSGIPYQQTAPQDDAYQGDPTAIGLGTSDPNQGVEQSIQQATQLAQSGQRDVLDSHAIATLAKYTDPSSKVLNYIPGMVSTLDHLGRTIFMSEWNPKEFQEMYGRSDLVEFSELIKSVFNNLGDLVIFLRRKFPEANINTNEQSADQI